MSTKFLGPVVLATLLFGTTAEIAQSGDNTGQQGRPALIRPGSFGDSGSAKTNVAATGGAQIAAISRLDFSPAEQDIMKRVALREASTEGSASDFDIAVGTRMPDSIMLVPFPDYVYAEITQLPPLRFVVVHNRILLVPPADRHVVYVMD